MEVNQEILLIGIVQNAIDNMDDAINGTVHMRKVGNRLIQVGKGAFGEKVRLMEYAGLYYKYPKSDREGVAKEIPFLRILINDLSETYNINFTEQLNQLETLEGNAKVKFARDMLEDGV